MHGLPSIAREAHVRTTFPVSLSLFFKPVKVVGYLTPMSAQKLRNYFDRRPWDRQILVPEPRGTFSTGTVAGQESQRSGSGSNDRQTRSQGPVEEFGIGPGYRRCFRTASTAGLADDGDGLANHNRGSGGVLQTQSRPGSFRGQGSGRGTSRK